MTVSQAQTIFLKDYRVTPYVTDEVKLDFDLDPDETLVHATFKVRPNPAAVETGADLVFNGEGLVLFSIRINGEALPRDRYVYERNLLRIRHVPQTTFSLEITNSCRPLTNTALSGLYVSNGIFCTQCEAEGFRRITFGYDRPDAMAVYTVRIEADKNTYPLLLSNGNPVEAGDLADTGRHFAIWHDPHSKPSYLFALVAGRLGSVHDIFTTASGRKVKLGIYVEPGKEDLCSFAMQALKASMRWDEQRFGREYDLDVFNIVAVSDFNMGAMENKGLNIFNDKYVLATAETAVDLDFERIEAIIAHEYFHNWTGNRITCRDWFQLCLKEGLTVYRDQEFTSDLRSRPLKRIVDVQRLRALQFPEDAGPLAHPPRPASYIEINNFYTSTVYEKGAEICRMLALLCGAEKFRSGMDLYFDRHDGQACTVEQFIACFGEVSGRDLGQFFRWYEQAGTPVVTARGNYDAGTGTFTLQLSQTVAPTPGEAEKQPLHIPLTLALVDEAGDDMPLHLGGRAMNAPFIELRENQAEFRFTGLKQRPRLSLNRGFSAPIILDQHMSQEDQLFLFAHDRDAFNRWQAGQALRLSLIQTQIAALNTDQSPPSYEAFITALKTTLADQCLDPGFKALLLASIGDAEILATLRENIDTDLVFQARRVMGGALAVGLKDHLYSILGQTEQAGAYSTSVTDVGQRNLRNRALSYLVSTGDSGVERVAAEYRAARHMTGKMGALTALSLKPGPAYDTALAAFYHQHRDDPLLIDKWFAVQAATERPDATAHVAALLGHPDFTWTNPNRVYAVLSGFTANNLSGFHSSTGRGYNLVADAVLKLDACNPQVAARVAVGFRSWGMMDGPRRKAASKALQHILAAPQLSPDVYEITSKTLKI